MKKIYLCIGGAYEDWFISAAFSNAEDAIKYSELTHTQVMSTDVDTQIILPKSKCAYMLEVSLKRPEDYYLVDKETLYYGKPWVSVEDDWLSAEFGATDYHDAERIMRNIIKEETTCSI